MSEFCLLKKAGEREFRCFFQLTTMIIGGKWKPKVLYYLGKSKSIRFSDLRRSIVGITEKMLIQSLKELQRDGIVHRQVFNQVPPRVEYSLTDIGQTLIPVLDAQYEWGKSYASWLIAKDEACEDYEVGDAFDDIEDRVTVS